MKAKMKDRPQVLASLLTVVLCLFTGLVNTGPLRSSPDDTSVVSSLPFTTSLATPYSVSTPLAISHSRPHSEPLLELRGTLAARKHDYALVCDFSQDYTKFCQDSVYGYYCKSNGALANKKVENVWCERNCECVDLAPRPCVFVNVVTTCFLAKDGTVKDNQLQTVGHINNATVHPNGTLSFEPRSLSLAKRETTLGPFGHDWALVCDKGSNPQITSYCQRLPREYQCSSNGVIATTGTNDLYCGGICRCVNLTASSPTRCMSHGVISSCHITTDGTILDFQNHPIGSVAAATQLPNGTWTLNAPAWSLAPRDLDLTHDYALVCGTDASNREFTQSCQKLPRAYYCNSIGQVSTTGKRNTICDVSCRCVNLNAGVANMCIWLARYGVCHVVQDGTILDNELQVIGHVNQSIYLGNNTLDITASVLANLAIRSMESETQDSTHDLLPAVSSRSSEMAMHDWALVCEDRKSTVKCAGTPYKYACNANGQVTKKDPELFCTVTCECVNLRPTTCIVSIFLEAACAVSKGVAFDATTGKVIGNVTDAVNLANGTLDFSQAIAERAVAKRDSDLAEIPHDYALVCIDRDRTAECSRDTYSCNSAGRVIYKKHDAFCDAYCVCVNLKPKCLVENYRAPVVCLIRHGVATFAENGSFIGNTTDAVTLPNGTLDFSQALAKRELEKRHNYALVCVDRKGTSLCSKKPFEYYCTQNAVLTKKGAMAAYCAANCKCINTNPNRPMECVIAKYVTAACYVKDTVVESANGTVIGQLSDAVMLDEGRLDFTSAATKRNSDEVLMLSAPVDSLQSLDEPEPHSEFPASVPETATTLDVSPSTKRDTDEEEDSWTLYCINKQHTVTCRGSPFGYRCEGPKVTHRPDGDDFVCSEICSCFNQYPSQICIPRNVHTSICPPIEYGNVPDDTSRNKSDDSLDPQVNTMDTPETSGLLATRDPAIDISRLLQIRCSSDEEHEDASLTNFCQNSGYSCVHDGGNLLPVLHHNSQVLEQCSSKCFCPRPYSNDSPLSLRSEAEVTSDNLPQAVEHGIFDMVCHSQGRPNNTLTEYCRGEQYSCALPSPDSLLRTLNHSGSENPECSSECRCPSPYAGTETVLKRSEGEVEEEAYPEVQPDSGFELTCQHTTDHPALNDLAAEITLDCTHTWGYSCDHRGNVQPTEYSVHHCNNFCHCSRSNHTNEVRSEAFEMFTTDMDVIDSTATAPPTGVSTQLASSTYMLNCGNRTDGPPYCMAANYGYFCLDNATVVRNSTQYDPGVTWCDFYCSCILRNPVPCVNEWNVPYCQEWIDGTVRNAARFQEVLGYNDAAYLLPNGSLLLDRGTPFIVLTNYTADD